MAERNDVADRQCARSVRYVTGPRLAGETGGGLGLRPKSSTWKVLASTTMDRYLPVGAAGPALTAQAWLRPSRSPRPAQRAPGSRDDDARAPRRPGPRPG